MGIYLALVNMLRVNVSSIHPSSLKHTGLLKIIQNPGMNDVGKNLDGSQNHRID